MDPERLPKHFDSAAAEHKWAARWQEQRLHSATAAPRPENRFVIDTPPPTVSGSLHIGHVFSYAHTDFLARFHRMRGRDVVYPMGWDDNGLPTERRVQNYFHVRCNPELPYDPALQLPQKPETSAPPRQVSRQNFIELCLQLTREDEKVFKALWTRVGLSVDWQLEYSTIDARCRAAAQRSFLDLLRKGFVYANDAPVMWDVDFQTTVAQAEVEDRKMAAQFCHVRFGLQNSSETFTIATTRPELLPACVGVTAHPEDQRYRHLFGRTAITPIFRVPVPIFPSELADPEKGTGILMVCTFGDITDVRWWSERRLPLRQVLGRNGRLLPVVFGDANWPSIDPEAANRYHSGLAGKTVREARRAVIELLRDRATAAMGGEPPLAAEPSPIEHSVKFFEKGDHPLEFITARQWFVRLLDKKDRLLELGDRIGWHPEHMRNRYRIWTENLALDWAISRQRYFGVPFPIWYPIDGNGEIVYDRPIAGSEDMLPFDPLDSVPAGYDESQRDRPGGFTAERDVFDTWFTSSLTPQIVAGWGEDPEKFARLFPMDLRPQSHEIIRTWAFYTIAKAYLHHDNLPWRNIAISGWILDPDRKKMSKSRGNVITPVGLIDEYGADAVRYWSAIAQLGTDTTFDLNVLKVGKRLVTKLFNASKFVLGRSSGKGEVSYLIDRAFIVRLKDLVRRATAAFDNSEHHIALAETERFFWTAFTDAYIEMSRSRTQGALGPEGQRSALATLDLALRVLLRLFAPFLPYITEEVWSWSFAESSGHASIHTAPWPSESEFSGIDADDDTIFDVAISAVLAVNRGRAKAGVSTAREIKYLALAAPTETAARLRVVGDDVRLAARARSIEIVEAEVDQVELRGIEFVTPTEQSFA